MAHPAPGLPKSRGPGYARPVGHPFITDALGALLSSNHRDQAAQPFDYLCSRHTEADSLLIRVGGGDRIAFAALYDRFSQTVYAMSLGSGHEPRLSTEVTSEVFLRAWREAPTYDPETGSAWRWLHAIALEAIVKAG